MVRGNCHVLRHQYFTNPLNSFDVNWVALSETMKSGTPNLATWLPHSYGHVLHLSKMFSKLLLLPWLVSCISISLVTWENCLRRSNNMNYYVDQQIQCANVTLGHELNFTGGTLAAKTHLLHDITKLSMSLSMLRQYTTSH